MASKNFALNTVGNITVVKRRSNRHLRLTIASGGQVRVSIPSWAPYQAGVDFALSKQSWIAGKRPVQKALTNDQQIGRSHRLYFKADSSLNQPKTRITGNTIVVCHPKQLEATHPDVQSAASKASIRALRQQAESLLPQRLKVLSDTQLLPYHSVTIKHLSRRWGSCDQNRHIVLNLFLIQLPWEIIDYVLLHELTHTRHLSHGSDFWNKLESMLPEARSIKKILNGYNPGIMQP